MVRNISWQRCFENLEQYLILKNPTLIQELAAFFQCFLNRNKSYKTFYSAGMKNLLNQFSSDVPGRRDYMVLAEDIMYDY